MKKYLRKIILFIWTKLFKQEAIRLINEVVYHNHYIFNSNGQLRIGNGSHLQNAFINLSSGNVVIGNNVSFGHNVSCLTGTHIINESGESRQHNFPTEGFDIVIEDGAWIGSNVTILGPCKIGKNAAIAAMSLLNKTDVQENTLYGGVPAKFIKTINL